MLTVKAKPGLVAHQMSTLIKWFKKQDSHYWIVALEHGASGYLHFQVRGESRFKFADLKAIFPTAHIEETANRCDYERKEGTFISSEDTLEILRVRFGRLRENQKEIIRTVETQNDREVDVFLDTVGNRGKSWLCINLYERGKACIVPRYCTTARELSNYICSAYNGEKYIIIDVPRAGKRNRDLFETIEEIKDGLVFDPRYSGKMRNIRGAKVIMFTNSKFTESELKLLSRDRWRLHGVNAC